MRKLLAVLACVLLLCDAALAQNARTISAKVTDDKGAALAGVTISALGSERRVLTSTLTDAQGNFTIRVSDRARTLQISYVGYVEHFIPLDGTVTDYTTKLLPNSSNLSEIVVVGYGTQRRKDATGSVANVSGAKIAETPVQSLDQGLAGRAAGVQITIPNGVLNTPPVFRIRGTNSISLSSYPLIVVDGVPSYTGDVSSTNAAGNALASINPNDIESIDIAKDAASTAIYGSRAANGVVFITTKKGRIGRTRVTYDGWVGVSQVYGLPQMLNAQQYTDYKNAAVANNPSIASTFKFNLTNGPDGQPINTNWNDYVYRNGFAHSNNISLSGGNENTTYYLSAGYTSQQGIIQKNDFKRANILMNIDSRVNKYITIGGKLSYSDEKNLAATSSGSLNGEAFNTGGLARLAVVNAPNVAPYNNDGSYNIAANNLLGVMGNAVTQVGFYNPVPILDLSRSNSFNTHLQGNAYVQVKPLNWLTLKTLYGFDHLLVDNDLFQNPVHGDGVTAVGNATSNLNKLRSSLWTNTAQFDYTFAGVHNVSVLVGNEQQRRTTLGYGINRQGLSDPVYNLIQAGFTINNSAGQSYGENYLLSNFGRVAYDFAKKYFISGNLRTDEYSALGQKKGTFWGVSAGYEIAKENFWTAAGLDRVFSSFKLRGSYGKVGNIGGIGDFASYSTYASGLYGGLSTLVFNTVGGGSSLRWETSKKTDIGTTFGLFKDRVTVEFAYWRNDIDGLILNVPQSPSTGLPSTVPLNVGTMYNKGIELTISATPVQTKDFRWSTSFNLTTVKNEVTDLAPGLSEIATSTSGSETVNKTKAGYSQGYLVVIPTAGVDPATGRRIFVNSEGKQVFYQFYAPTGQFNYSFADGTKYVNSFGETSINAGRDGIYYANTQPKAYGGWDNTFTYRGFSLNVLLTYQTGFYVYYGSNAGIHDQRFWNNAVDVLGAWKKAGDVVSIPKPVFNDNVSNGSAMPLDINVFKGDFVKVKNISLSYSLPPTLMSKVGISNFRLYASVQNLAIFTKYPGPDPEVSSNGTANGSQGVDRNTAANARTFTFGINASF